MSFNKQDFSTIYDEYYPKIVRYLARLIGELEAEDAAQETFVKIGRSLDTFRGASSLSTWIYRIATNTAMDHLRRPSSSMMCGPGFGRSGSHRERESNKHEYEERKKDIAGRT